MNFSATIIGGIGPNVWDTCKTFFADDITDALKQAVDFAKEINGTVTEIFQDE